MTIKKKDKVEDVKTEVVEDVKTETVEDAKSIGESMAKAFAAEMKKEEKEVKTVPAKIVKDARVIVSKDAKDQPCKGFKSVREMEAFAKTFVPEHLLQKFGNHNAVDQHKAAPVVSTYGDITASPDAGSLDPTTVSGILAETVATYGNSGREDCLNVPVYNSTASFVDMNQDLTSYIIAESAELTQSKQQFTTHDLTMKKIAVLAPLSNELLRFATLADISTETLKSCGRAIAAKETHLIWTAAGTADSTDGSLEGIQYSMDTTQVASNTAIKAIEGTWSDIDIQDLASIVANVSDWTNYGNAKWYMSRSLWGVLEGISRALGSSYVVQTGQKPIPSLMGYPVSIINKLPATASGDPTLPELFFGDLSGAMAIGSPDKVYVDTNDGIFFANDCTAIRCIKHWGQKCYAPGTNGTTTSVCGVTFSSAS